MFTASQIVAHFVGDYLIQSDWMALNKTKSWVPAIAHVATYAIPFLFLTQDWRALLIIVGSHLLIDRFRLARYVCYAKNFLAPRSYWYKWEDCQGTGYHTDRPAWLSVWLMIIADNILHIICNAIALQLF